MFFSLTNTLATFQSFVNDIFSKLINKESVVVYLNDCQNTLTQDYFIFFIILYFDSKPNITLEYLLSLASQEYVC